VKRIVSQLTQGKKGRDVIYPTYWWCAMLTVNLNFLNGPSARIVRLGVCFFFFFSIFIFCTRCIPYLVQVTRCMPVRCYGHPIIYKATHKTYNKNFSIEGITCEERLEVERTVWYVNLIVCPSDYDKYTQNDTLRLFKIYVVMRRSYCLQCLVGIFSKHLLHAPQDRRRNYVA
jgi:hypothetical protein